LYRPLFLIIYIYHFHVLSAARHAIHLQFDIGANALGIRAVHTPKFIVRCAGNCPCRFWEMVEFSKVASSQYEHILWVWTYLSVLWLGAVGWVLVYYARGHGFDSRALRSTARHSIRLQFDISANAIGNKGGTKYKVYNMMCCWLYKHLCTWTCQVVLGLGVFYV
jgi:hypothetical protein